MAARIRIEMLAPRLPAKPRSVRGGEQASSFDSIIPYNVKGLPSARRDSDPQPNNKQEWTEPKCDAEIHPLEL